MRTPRLHVVTEDAVLADPTFPTTAAALLRAHGPAVALHLRASDLSTARLHALAAQLADAARESGAALLVNDRLDVALTVDAGVQLGVRSLPLPVVRALLGPDRLIGYSAHGAGEAAEAAERGADFVLLGTIWRTASHPGRPGAGPELIAKAAERVTAPLVAIGGVTPARAAEAIGRGAYGVAVLSGVWRTGDPVAGAERYLEAMGAAAG